MKKGVSIGSDAAASRTKASMSSTCEDSHPLSFHLGAAMEKGVSKGSEHRHLPHKGVHVVHL